MIIFKQSLSSIYCDLLCVLSLEKALEAVREKEDLGGGMIPKGQIISERFFDDFKFSEKPTKNLTNLCPRI